MKTMKDHCFFLADNRSDRLSDFWWYVVEDDLYNDIAKKYCEAYISDGDQDRENDFLKKFDAIHKRSKFEKLKSKEIFNLLRELLSEFKIPVPYWDFRYCYIGTGSNLLRSDETEAIQIRGLFRTAFYGFKLKTNAEWGKAPIDVRELIRFQEFISQPIESSFD